MATLEMITGYRELPEDLKRYIPDYEYLLYDLTKYKDEDVKLQSITRMVLKIMRDVRYAEKDSITHYMESYLRYVLSVRNDIDKDQMIQISSQISVEGSELVMSIAEQLKQEGIGIGVERGRREKITKVVKNAIVKGMEVDDIVELTGLSKKDIEKIRKETLQ